MLALSIRRTPFAALGLALAALMPACADLGPYVWNEQFSDPQAPADGGYVISNGDVLQIRVFNQENMTTKARVRSDGKISIPLLNDVAAAGYTPAVLGQQLETRLKDFIKLPIVTVSIEESKPLAVLVAGEVSRQGQVSLDPGSGVLPALLAAGGLTDFAHKDRIFVVRQLPGVSPPVRIRFIWEALLRAQDRSAAFRLHSGDTIVVE